MIATPHHHYDAETLQRLLDDELTVDQADRIEDHLSRCDQCRDQMEEMAAQRAWWKETVDILSASTKTSGARQSPAVRVATPNRDASVDWIVPLLDPPCEPSEGLGRIDQYAIREIIGQGGMGVVLRGIDPELNRPVAIKVLSPHLAGVGAARARFMREAQASATIVHPSIVPIYSVVTTSRLPYIVMPCIGGGNLQQRIDREGPLELAELLRIGVQIAEGLSAAHRHGVIHRDIKPANILVEEGNGRVLISDFGLARALDDATLTVSGMIAGTPQYMSPEQARGDVIDARSDLFSLGSLLYALATGRPPYRAESPLAVLRKISESNPRPIHQVNESVPQWFDALVRKLMIKNPDERIQTADHAAELLREAHAHVRHPAANALPTELSPVRKYRSAFALVVATAMLVPGSAIGLVWKRFSEPSHLAVAAPTPQNPSSTGRLDDAIPYVEQRAEQELGWHADDVREQLGLIQQTLIGLEESMSRSAAEQSNPFIPMPATDQP